MLLFCPLTWLSYNYSILLRGLLLIEDTRINRGMRCFNGHTYHTNVAYEVNNSYKTWP